MRDIIPVQERITVRNDELAAALKSEFDRRRTFVINLISSPGSGKTTLLERLLPSLSTGFRCAVLEGDLQTENDARRIAATGVPVHQIITCNACHLDARMVQEGLARLPAGDRDLLIIENVGNLVCPASYTLGEDVTMVVLSTAEGDDKPVKYPVVFRKAGVLIINKTDLLELTDFSMEKAIKQARGINPGLQIFPLSCRTGDGLPALADWIRQQVLDKRGTSR